MRRSLDEGRDGASANKRRRGGPPRAAYCFKALCPDTLTFALLGAKGAVKDQIQRETGTKFVFSNKGDYYPESHFRVLGVYADDIPRLHSAFDAILSKIVQCGDEERERPPQNGPDMVGKEPGEYIFRFCIPQRTSSALMGPGGSKIKQLRQDTSAKVFVDNETLMGHQMVRVIGQQENILPCLERINELVQQESGTEDYNEYAQMINFGQETAAGSFGPPDGLGRGPLPPVDDRGSEQAYPPHGGAGGCAPRSAPAGPDSMAPVDERVHNLAEKIRSMPLGTSRLDYSISFDMQDRYISELMGDYRGFVEQSTGSRFDTPGQWPAGEPRPISIVGPLLNIYAAHLLLSKKVVEIDQREEMEQRGQDNIDNTSPEELRDKIGELQAQLAEARQSLGNPGGGGGGGRKGGKGKGKGKGKRKG